MIQTSYTGRKPVSEKKKPEKKLPESKKIPVATDECSGTGNTECSFFGNAAGGQCSRLGGKCIIKNPSAKKNNKWSIKKRPQ